MVFIGIVIAALVSIIHFQIYDHFWFLRLTGLDIHMQKQNALFLLLFFLMAGIHQLILLKENSAVKISNSSKRLFLPLLFYFLFGIVAVIVHEPDFDSIERYLFYLFTPLMVFLGIFAAYRSNKGINTALHILFLLGVIFSVYSIGIHHAMSDIEIQKMHGFPSYYLREYLNRFTIPGLGPNVLPSMLVPMVLTGFYFVRSISGKSKYLYIGLMSLIFYSIIITASRGAVVSLSAGMLYLAYKRWLKFDKETLLIIASFCLVLFIAGNPLFSRINRPFVLLEKATAKVEKATAKEEKATAKVEKATAKVEKATAKVEVLAEARIVALVDSFTSYIMFSPVMGSGFSYFIASQEQRLKGLGNHNLYVTLLAQGGLMVFIPFALILAALYVNSNEIMRRNMSISASSRKMGIFLNAALIAYIIDLNFPPGFFHYYWIWFGFAAAWARNCEMEYRAPAQLSGAEAI